MGRGTYFTWPALAIAVAGCAGEAGQLTVRAAQEPFAAALRPGSSMLANARAMLAMGNSGLASEAFRKVLRQQPDNIEALAGLAACYGQMGRHDLARSKYEAALAIAPNDPVLLHALAATLDRQGRAADAKRVRAEASLANTREAAELVKSAALEASPEKMRIPDAPPTKAAAGEISPPPSPVVASTRSNLPASPRAGSITVKLPPMAPAREPEAVKSALARVEDTARESASAPPRLERLSLAEVRLVTTGRPRWGAEVVQRTANSTTVRFVPIAELRRSAPVRLLNAARHQGLAARTRTALNRKGWGRVSIGDAGRVRSKSLVLYSPATAAAARRLASEFGFGIAKDPRPGPLTVLLGRDAARRAISIG